MEEQHDRMKTEIVKRRGVLWSDKNVLQLMNTHKNQKSDFNHTIVLCCALLPSSLPFSHSGYRRKEKFSFPLFLSLTTSFAIRHKRMMVNEHRIDFPRVYHKNVSNTENSSHQPPLEALSVPPSNTLRLSHFIIVENGEQQLSTQGSWANI